MTEETPFEEAPVGATVAPRKPWLPALVGVAAVVVVSGGSFAVVQALSGSDGAVVVIPSETPLAGPTPSIGVSLVPQPDPSEVFVIEVEPEPSIEPLPLVSATPEPGPEPSPTPSVGPSVAPSADPSPKPQVTATPTPTATLTPTPTPTQTPTPTPRQGVELGAVYQFADDAWSPTRPEFAFIRQDNRGELAVFLPETGETLVLSKDIGIPRHGSSIHWSPDGESIALLARNYWSGGDALIVYSHDDWGQVLRIDAQRIEGLDWSDDGTRILVSYSEVRHDYYHQGEDCIIYEVDLATGEGRPIVEGVFPSWSPDEASIAYLGDDEADGTWGTWLLDLSTEERIALSAEHPFTDWNYGLEPNTRFTPAWSPDGSALVFVSSSDRVFVASDGSAHPQSATFYAKADGSEAQKVYDYAYYRPGWSPDGTRFYVLGSVHDATTLKRLFVVESVIHGRIANDEFLTRTSAKSIAVYDWNGVQAGFQKVESGWHLDRFLGWSADGLWIAIYGTGPDSETEIKGIVPANGLP